jgi:glucose/arabinose dehydrogenase
MSQPTGDLALYPAGRRTIAALLMVGMLIAGCGTADSPGSAGPPPNDTGATAYPTVPEPTDAEPTDAEPAVTEPGVTEPATSEPTTANPSGTQVLEPTLEGTLVEGLDAPWGLAFLPKGGALVTERDNARIVRVDTEGSVTAVGDVPGAAPGGEGGLLGITLSPGFAEDRLVYVYFTGEQDNRVVRMSYDESGGLGEPEVVIDGIPKATVHNGGRLLFGPDDLLYVATGDSSDEGLSQDLDSLAGKILRLTSEGAPAPDNPFGNSPVYTLGHRNVQGLAFDSRGQLWASEFGQNTFDELNRIEAGGNYGWPAVEGTGGGEEFIDPVVVWEPAEASPSGIAVAGSSVWLAALRGARLWQVPIPDGEVADPVEHFTGDLGRLRHVAEAPDGSLWVMTNNTDGRGEPRPGDDRIVRVTLS